MSVPVDLTISRTIDEIYTSFNGRIPKTTIKAVIDFQSYSINRAMQDGDNIHIKYIGKFVFNHKRAYKVQEDGIQGTMQTEQEIIKKEGSKSYRIKEIKRIVFK